MAIATTAKKVSSGTRNLAWVRDRLKDFLLRSRFQRKITGRDRIFFTSQLALMQEIGSPLNTSLSAIARQTRNPAFQTIISNLTAVVEEGKMFSEALKRYPRIFSPEYISLVHAGEKSGHLQEMLERAVELEERRVAFVTALKGAMTYPLVLCVVTTGVVVFMLAYVFPRFTTLFQGVEEILPPTTRFLMALSVFMRRNWYLLVLFSGVAGLGISWFLKTRSGRGFVDRMKITVPFLSGVYIRIYLAQMMRTLGSLIGSNVPLLDSLKIVRGSTKNLFFIGFMDRIIENVESGKGFAPAFFETSYVPETVSQMVRTGEESRKLDRVLLRLSDYYEGEIKGQVQRFTTVIEPVLLILMGIVVGVIVISLILPIFKLARVVH